LPNQRQLIAIPDIVDNSRKEQKLCNVLNVLLTAGGQAHIASGYFNLDGYRLIKDALNDVSEFRLLLGCEPALSR